MRTSTDPPPDQATLTTDPPLHPASALFPLMVAAGSYLHRLETGAAGGVPHDLRGALAVYGGRVAYADEMLSLAEPPAPVAGLPVVFPIPAPGWVQRIATPRWPADLAAHMSPPGVTNQCVAGALATWAMMHPGDPRWNHPPPLFGNAIDLYGVARAEGFQLDSHPTPGAMVVYGSAYGVFGHIGTVRAVQGDRYEVVEQNSATAMRSSSRTSSTSTRTWRRTGRPSIYGRWHGRIRRWWGSSWRRRWSEGGCRLTAGSDLCGPWAHLTHPSAQPRQPNPRARGVRRLPQGGPLGTSAPRANG